ncbi:elicitor peptide 6 [Macadamia integrifolia]|uniref:elicitor peptide 6 n=1 Tax=Macadamia integrifolia TaxID=60698 RepID=UPI001C4EBECA|nr:elicitor peptide 6 [Macadamia integrifolia]
MEELKSPKQRRTAAAAASSSHGNPCDLVQGAISAVFKCLGLDPFYWPFSKQGEDTNTHQNTSYHPSPSTEEAQDPQFPLSEFGTKTCEGVAVGSITVNSRRPKPPPISPGEDPQHN